MRTVFGEMTSSCAIQRFENPWAIKRRTFCSRSVSGSIVAGSEGDDGMALLWRTPAKAASRRAV